MVYSIWVTRYRQRTQTLDHRGRCASIPERSQTEAVEIPKGCYRIAPATRVRLAFPGGIPAIRGRVSATGGYAFRKTNGTVARWNSSWARCRRSTPARAKFDAYRRRRHSHSSVSRGVERFHEPRLNNRSLVRCCVQLKRFTRRGSRFHLQREVFVSFILFFQRKKLFSTTDCQVVAIAVRLSLSCPHYFLKRERDGQLMNTSWHVSLSQF